MSIEDYEEVGEIVKALEDGITFKTGLEQILYDIEQMPSVTPAPKKCHNINTNYDDCGQFVCSNCGIELQDWHRVERDEDDGDITYHQYEFNYCPNCGAKMDEGESE